MAEKQFRIASADVSDDVESGSDDDSSFASASASASTSSGESSSNSSSSSESGSSDGGGSSRGRQMLQRPKPRIKLSLRATTSSPPKKKSRGEEPPDPPAPPSSFEIVSGALCYGSEANVRLGSSRPIQSPTEACGSSSEFGGGTVLVNPSLAYNVAALNGDWRVHRLVHVDRTENDVDDDAGGPRLEGFFCCHASIDDAEEECRRLLRVAGSNNEGDDAECGPNRNTDATREAGVLVINRYDWEGDNPDEERGAWQHGCISLCDYGSVAGRDRKDWEAKGRGAVLNLPRAEYRYGRVGLDRETDRARSFLYFGDETRFVETRMEGRTGPLVPKTTPEERYRTRLASGERFDGFDSVLYAPVLSSETGRFESPPRPPSRLSGLLVGPFSTDGHRIFLDDDLDAVRRAGPASDCPFEPSLLKGDIGPLLDELVMSYLAATLLPALASTRGGGGGASVADGGLEHLFLNPHGHLKPMYKPSLRALTTDPGPSLDGMDRVATTGRLETFATSQGYPWPAPGPSSVQVCVMMEYVLGELLETAKNAARDLKWPCIVPLVIRSAIMYDQELCEMLERSSALWLPMR